MTDTKTKLSIRVVEVENGYLVYEHSDATMYMSGKSWVASSIADLSDLIAELAMKAKAAGA